jgi:hypothetical protein
VDVLPGVTTGSPALDVALARLAVVCPAATGAAATLETVLAGVRDRRLPEEAWRFSRLTADGFPVELSFVTGQPGSVRYAAEVAGPGTPNADRLDLAAAVLDRLGHPLPPAVAGALARMQADRPLRWGAWVGVRHGPGGAGAGDGAGVGAKVYAEVPPGAGAPPGWPAPRPCGPLRLRMIGYEPGRQRVEYYYRLGRLDFPMLADLLRLGGSRAALGDVTAVLRLLAGQPAGGPPGPLPAARFGCSVALRPATDGPVEVAVFAAALDLAGDDHRTRAAVDAVLDRRGWDLPGYRLLTAGTAHRGVPLHGMLGIAAVGGRIALSVGLSVPGVRAASPPAPAPPVSRRAGSGSASAPEPPR